MATGRHLYAAFACLAPQWPNRQPALLRRGFPTAGSAQADRASPAQWREREKGEETHREKDQLAQQLSRALRCCLPLPLRCTETHRCLPAASLPFTHEHGLVLLSHTSSLAWWSALITEECRRRLEDSTVAQEVSTVSPSLGMPSSVPPSLYCLPHPNNNTQTDPSKHDLQLHY